MRQYNMAWQQIYELLVGMSVVVGTGEPYSWSISADQQWLQVFLIDDETNPNITQVTVDLAPVIPDTPLPAPEAMTVTSCEPTTVATTDEDIMLIVNGTKFNPTSQILLGTFPVETIAVSSVELATVFSPQLAPGFGDMQVQVQDGTLVVPPSPSTVKLTITSTNKATSATAGLPGAWAPTGALRPLNFAALTSAVPAITATPVTAWGSGQYVVLGDQSEAHWNGTAWVAGRAPTATAMQMVGAQAGPTEMPPDPAEVPVAPSAAEEEPV